MQLFNLLSSFASQYTQKYLNRANAHTPQLPPGHNRELLPSQAAIPTRRLGQTERIDDAYLPSTEVENEITDPIYTNPEATTNDAVTRDTVTRDIVNPDLADPEAIENEQDDDQADAVGGQPIRVTREAELGYNLTLQFDLTAFTRTIERLAEGEISEIDQLAMASFGLSTQFEVSGKEVIEIETADAVDQNFHALGMQSLKSRQASMFSVQSRDFQALSFQRESTDMRQKIDIKFKDNARRAVNKFALRYSSDSQFSFRFAQRLNLQTEQVAEQSPDSVGGYLDSAGDVANSGTNEMMAAFFDAVEGYLSSNQAQTSENVTAFFGQAAEALGFAGGELAQFAETNLASTIDSFFANVSSAVAELRTVYLGESASTEIAQPIVAEIPADYGTTDRLTDQLAVA